MRLYSGRHHGCRVNEYVWRGHRLIVLENELVRFSVLASKGADIVEARYKPLDLDIFWHAPQPVLPPGEQIPTVARPNGAFLDYFPGGWQEVLPNAGPASSHRGAALGQHGEVALLPWDAHLREDDARRVEVEFAVETIRTPFRLIRRMSLASGSPVLELDEAVVNLGEQPMAYAWGHHPALGPPFLEAGCVIELPDCDVVQPTYAEALARRFAVNRPGKYPWLESAVGKPDRVDVVQGKEARTEDVLLFSNLREGRCAVRNPRTGVRVALRWPKEVFPYFWCWQVYGGSWDYPYYGRIHTLAIEPFNCPILPIAEAAGQQLLPELAPGAKESAHLEFEITTG